MKTKTILSFLLAIAMIFSLAACGTPSSPAPAAETTVPAAETPAEEVEEQEELVPVTDADAQISLIYTNLESMKQPEVGNEWKYTVTDLDHNGRMELIAASQHPADRSTNFKVWEVSEDRTALNECSVPLEEDESFPDILTENADTFHNTENDTWSYLFFDHIVISPEEAYTSKCSVTLKNGVIRYESYAFEHTEVTDGVSKVTHLDTNGLTISPEQYNAAGVNALVGCEKSSTNFGWFTMKEEPTFADLVESYYYFTGDNQHANVMPAPTPAPTPAP
ncbi:MAG: hypothetical protein IKT07_09240, partial [Oscillospiraceae bacterium]|nr:hypothetical protein [Oscillospiraceae bacterium]